VPEDEDLQITALREELMKEIESVRGDVKSLKTGQTIILTGLGIFIGLCSLIIGVLAFSANIF
jgi:hypothetical protein